MRRKLLLLISLAGLAGFSGCKPFSLGKNIPVIGLNKDGKEVIKMVPMKSYANQMSSMINHTTENLSEKLREYGNNPWSLSRVDLNVVITFGFSVFDVVGMEIAPGFRLQYSKK